MKLVIGISGKAQNGKDTIADWFVKNHPEIQKVAFANLLKEQAKYLGWDGEKDLGGRTFIQTLSEPIKAYGNWLAQKYPDEYGDFSDNRYYSASLYRQIINSPYNYFVISDVRFYNEWQLLKSKTDIKFISIRVNRFENGTVFNNGLSEEQKHHNSETELDNVQMDYTINNDGTVDDLYKKLEFIDKEIFNSIKYYLPESTINAYKIQFNKLLEHGFDEYGRILDEKLEKHISTKYGVLNKYAHVHYFENDTFSLCPYYNGKDPVLKEIPNFYYKKDNFTLNWTKKPLNNCYCNNFILTTEFNEIINNCIKSLEEE